MTRGAAATTRRSRAPVRPVRSHRARAAGAVRTFARRSTRAARRPGGARASLRRGDRRSGQARTTRSAPRFRPSTACGRGGLAPDVIAPAMALLTQDPLLLLRSEVDAGRGRCGLERLLTCVRTLLLDAALESKDDISREMMPFACALARQCFINEYVFACLGGRAGGVVAWRGKLGGRTARQHAGVRDPADRLACYAPLARSIATRRSSPDSGRTRSRRLIDRTGARAEGRGRSCAPRRRA